MCTCESLSPGYGVRFTCYKKLFSYTDPDGDGMDFDIGLGHH